MPAGVVDLEITVGEDWTVQVQSLDDHDRPKKITSPARMDIKDGQRSILHTLITQLDLDPLEIPSLAVSDEVGIIQLHIPRSVSQNFIPGSYQYDLWVTVDDGGEYAGQQATPEIQGRFIVNDRVTESF